MGVGVTKDAEPAAGHRPKDVLLPAVDRHLLELVLAVAEEGEVLVGEPLEQRLALGDLRLGQRWRVLLEVRDDRARPVLHGRPVLDRRPDVTEHTSYVVGEQHALVALLGQPVDLDVHPRLAHGVRVRRRRAGRHRVEGDQLPVAVTLDVERRVQYQVGVAVLARQLHGERVDQERHVVGDDLDHGVPARRPAVLSHGRRVDADLGRAGLPFGGEVVVRRVGAIDVDVGSVVQLLGADVAVVRRQQGHEVVARRRRGALAVAGHLGGLLDDLVAVSVVRRR